MCKLVCPWWLGFFLANPLRKIFQNPDIILKNYVNEGMKILEIGPGMGFFTFSLAKLTGNKGKVYSIDIQKKMLDVLNKKSMKHRLSNVIETRVCSETSLKIDDLANKLDFALLFAVVHEIPDKNNLFLQLNNTLKKGSKVLISEPKGHVSDDNLSKTINIAKSNNFIVLSNPKIKGSKSVLLEKN